MSAPKKLRGGSDSELTKFKKLWRDTFSETQKDFWRSRFLSDSTQAELRKEIRVKTGIDLTYDKQLGVFRDWDFEQQKRDLEAEQMLADERSIKQKFGDAISADELREKVIAASYHRTLTTGDFKLGLKTANTHLKEKSLQFEETKFKEQLRDKLQAGLDEVAAAFKKNPEAMEFYKKARALISRETK